MKLRRRTVAGVSVIAVGSLAVLGGGYASLSSSDASEAQRIESGTLSLSIEGPGGGVEFEEPISNLAAGDSAVRYADVVNTGTLDLADLTATTSNLGGLLVSALDVRVDSCSVAWTAAADACLGTSVPLIASDLTAWGSEALPLPELAIPRGSTAHLRFTTRLAPGAPNTLQGQEATVRYAISGGEAGAATEVEEEVGETTPTTPATILTTWSETPSMTTPRMSASAATVGDSLYAFGGYTTGFAYTSTTEVLDPATNAWSPRASAPTARTEAGTAVIGDLVYVVGGSGPTGRTPALEAYDTRTDTWTTLSPMPIAMNSVVQVEVVGGRLYVVGTAANRNPSYEGVIESYDPATGSWTVLERNPALRDGGSTFVVGDEVRVLGGFTAGSARTNWSYDVSEAAWSLGPDLPFDAQGGEATSVSGTPYYVTAANAVYSMDPRTGVWTLRGSVPSGFVAAFFTSSGDALYVLGGWGPGYTSLSTRVAVMR